MKPKRERSLALGVIVVFIALLAVPGLHHVLYGVGSRDIRRYERFLREESPSEAFRKIETDLDQRFLAGQAARTLALSTPMKALKPGGGDSIRTADGNLIYAADRDVPRTAGFLDRTFGKGRDIVGALSDFRRGLASRDIHLIVVPVPAKASLYPDSIDPGYPVADGPNLNPDHAAWIALLRKSGIHVIDLTDAFWAARKDPAHGPIYHLTDSHWSPRAIEIAAEAIAREASPYLKDVATTPFEVRPRTIRRHGDLRSSTEKEGPPDITEPIAAVVDPMTGAMLNPGDDAPVLVIGDSFAEFYSEIGGALHQQLIRQLHGIPVQCAAIVGASPNQIRQIVADKPQLLTHKKVVILAYTIRLNLNLPWKPIPLPVR